MYEQPGHLEDGAMEQLLHPVSPDHETHPAASPASKRWLAAAAAAIGMQVAAVIAALGAAVIVLVAAFASWGRNSDPSTPFYVWFSIPLAAAAVGLFIGSGIAAARIANDRRGWFMLALGPVVAACTTMLLGVL